MNEQRHCGRTEVVVAEANVQQEVHDGQHDKNAGQHHVEGEYGHQQKCLKGPHIQLVVLRAAADQLVEHDGHEEHQVEEHAADAHQHAEHQRGCRVAHACRAREQEKREHQLHGAAGEHQRALR